MRISRTLAVFSLGLAGFAMLACRGSKRDDSSELSELVAGSAGQRLVEPRLTGELAHAPCDVAVEPDRLLPRATCFPAPEIHWYERLMRFVPKCSRGSRGATGKGRFLGPARQERAEKSMVAAIAGLEAMAAQEPRDAAVLNGLAASYFVRASHQGGEPRDLVRALDAAARACKVAPDLPEAWFNLALILDRLHLGRLATSAWKEYLALEPDPAWMQEARDRLEALGRPAAPERWQQALPMLESAALRDEADSVQRIVAIDPQLAREHAVEQYLGRWADRVLAGDEKGARRNLRVASAIGRALLAINGDRTVEAAVAAVEDARSSPGALGELASGHRAFRAGMEAYRPLRVGEACAHFAVARQALRRGGSPVELWALSGLARCWGYEGRYDAAARAYGEVLSEAIRRGFPSLAGWTWWGLGWVAARQALPAEALGQLREMEKAFEQAREGENLGAAHLLVGDALALLGQEQAAWRSWFRALGALAAVPTAFRRHVLLQGVATAALAEGLPEAGLLVQEEGLRIAEESQNPTRVTEALWARSRILAALARTDEALAGLKRAKLTVAEAPRDATGRKLRADLLWTEGEVLAQRDPGRAVAILTAALEEYRALKSPLGVVYGSVARAKAELALGRDREAFGDLEEALRILEDPATGIREEDLRISYSESIQDVYDEMIRFQWDQSRENALVTLERARLLANLAPGRGLEDLGRLPERKVVIEYALLPDRLLIWMVLDGKLSSFERRVKSSELEALVERFIRTVQRGANKEDLLALSSRLHDLLIPEPVRSLPRGRTIHFVPDRILNRVPFAALQDRAKGRPLIEDHAVAIAPSLVQLILAERRPAVRRGKKPAALIVGNPAFDRDLFPSLGDLAGAKDELASARAAFGESLTLTGEEATKHRLLAQLDRFDAFVFAGHAVVNSALPSRSYLVLSPSAEPPDMGLLLGAEIAARDLSHLRLVVLSACSSVGPREARVSGIAGLAQPFLEAGAQTVVGTLWDVADRNVAAVLRRFYQALADGLPPVHALREAQLAELRNANGWKDLRTWSALAVVELDSAAEGSLESGGNGR